MPNGRMEAMNRTLGRIRDAITKCANFFADSDWCNDKCIMWSECVKASMAQDATKPTKEPRFGDIVV